MSSTLSPVLVLGAGINGAAIARELVLNRVPVWIVDRADIASGATAASSRLIHGGLRYLEYGDFDLVRESLQERTRLLRLAPHLVRPIQLFIPVQHRLSGLAAGVRRLLQRGQPAAAAKQAQSRGLWLIRTGLWLYDHFAGDAALPDPQVFSSRDARALPLDPARFRWQCAYYDAQVLYPERLTVELLADARSIAAELDVEFRVFSYHQARRADPDPRATRFEIRPRAGGEGHSLEPSAIVNATGAWVDETLSGLSVDAPRQMGGTQGSHLVTSSRRLQIALAGRGVYCEAADGRPVFILPWGQQTLIGTTDLPYSGDPGEAVASPEEVTYLIGAVNQVLPQVELTLADIDLSYSGIRPLPYSDASTPAAVTRRHFVTEHPAHSVPCFSIVGGKLTTARSLAEEAAGQLLARLGREKIADSRDRALPGARGFPQGDAERVAIEHRLARECSVPREAVQAVMLLWGGAAESILRHARPDDARLVAGTTLPRAAVRYAIEREWATTLDDLVSRRLMLLFGPTLSRETLRELCELLSQHAGLDREAIEPAVEAFCQKLQQRHGRHLGEIGPGQENPS